MANMWRMFCLGMSKEVGTTRRRRVTDQKVVGTLATLAAAILSQVGVTLSWLRRLEFSDHRNLFSAHL